MRKRRRSNARAALVTLVACLLLPGGARAEAEEPAETPRPNPAVVAVDLVLVRPLNLAVLPIGAALFVPAALLTAPDGMDSLRTAYELFVGGPASYVFQRPLGEF